MRFRDSVQSPQRTVSAVRYIQSTVRQEHAYPFDHFGWLREISSLTSPFFLRSIYHNFIILVLLASIWRECFQWWLQSENDWYLRLLRLIQWPDVSWILSCFLIDYLAWRRIDRGISDSHHITFAAKTLSDTVLVRRRCLPRTCSWRCHLKLINDHNLKKLISVRQCLLPASFLILTYVVRNQRYSQDFDHH